jgi:phytoene dehydrogenase-like protein
LHQANLKDLKHPKLVQLLTDMQHIMVQIHIKLGIMGIILITNIMSEPFPTEGMNSITTSLVKLAEDIGVNFFTTVQLKKYLLILYKKSYGSQSKQ